MALKAFRADDGTEVRPGDIVTDWRDNDAEFHAVTRGPSPGRSAKVQVDGQYGPEYYAQVFKLDVREA